MRARDKERCVSHKQRDHKFVCVLSRTEIICDIANPPPRPQNARAVREIRDIKSDKEVVMKLIAILGFLSSGAWMNQADILLLDQ
jgi:hypothetical protein